MHEVWQQDYEIEEIGLDEKELEEKMIQVIVIQ
jgi:hypothetical protein